MIRPSITPLVLMVACASPKPLVPVSKPPAPLIERSQGPEAIDSPADDRLNPHIRPSAYQVRLDLDPRRADYGGQVRIDLELKATAKVIWLHSEAHEVYAHSLTLNGKRITGTRLARGKPDWLAVRLPKAHGPAKGHLLLQFRGEMTTPLFGMYRTEHAGEWYIYTQFEALGARKAFPCFDEPSFKATFSVQIRTPESDRAFANAPLANKPKIKGGRKNHVFKTTPPLPTYLLALAVGPIDIAHDPKHDLKRADGSQLRIRILTPKGKAALAELALRETKKILVLEEAYFGTPYPFAKLDLVAVPDFAAGAMENPGLITYRDRLLLMDEKTVTQRELMSYANTHAHELAHIWFGDLVTMVWWDDLWLNEAFATWFAAKIVDQYRPDWQIPIERLGGKTWVMDVDSTRAARRIREPIKNRGDILNAFDGITYTKGAAVLHMFERFIGEEAFRNGVRAYLKAHEWGNATFADLVGALATSSGKKTLPQAFGSFIDQAGVPLIDVARPDPTTLKLKQTRWSPLGKTQLDGGPWLFPFCAFSVSTDSTRCTELSKTGDLRVDKGAILPNPGMQSYTVWKLAKTELETLLKGFAKLSEIDQVAILQNLRKLYRSGDLDPMTISRITPDLLRSKHDRVIATALSFHGELGRLVTDAQIPAWKQLRNGLISDLLLRYGWGDASEKDPARWRARNQVLGIAGIAGKRPEVVQEAQAITEAFLQDKDVNRETLRTALSITAEFGDEALFDRLLNAFLTSDDIRRRGPLRGGLGRFRFPGVVDRLFALLEHKKLRSNERSGMLWPVASDYRTRAEAWLKLQPLLPKLNDLLPRRGLRYLPYFPGAACRDDLAGELDKTFRPWLEKVEGLERHLKTAKEQLEQCLALRQAYGASLKGILVKNKDLR